MQKQKDQIKQDIQNAAKSLFLRNGFAKTSMREIARISGVGLSNIYNYFETKDVLFREILRPVILKLDQMIYSHDAAVINPAMFTSLDYKQKEVEEYIRLAKEFREHLQLLLFRSKGSSLENFREEYTDKMTKTIHLFFKELKQQNPYINIEITDFFIHLNTSWLFTLLEELVMHHVKKKELEAFITEYISFEIAGWKELMRA